MTQTNADVAVDIKDWAATRGNAYFRGDIGRAVDIVAGGRRFALNDGRYDQMCGFLANRTDVPDAMLESLFAEDGVDLAEVRSR